MLSGYFAAASRVLVALVRAGWRRVRQAYWTAYLDRQYCLVPNIRYRGDSIPEAILNLYLPRHSERRHPTVLYLHGGGWVGGNHDLDPLVLRPFLELGWAVVSLAYRTAQVAPAPAAVEDCRCALWWVIRHAEAYHIDRTRLVVTGPSSGGHLALLTGMMLSSAHLDGAEPGGKQVAAIINWFGITDVTDLLDGPHRQEFAVTWLGHQPNPEEIAQQVSPLTYVRPGLPPILTIHGDADDMVPYAHAVRLHVALTRAGVPNQLLTIADGDHGGFTPAQLAKIYMTIRAFLAQHLPAALVQWR